MIGWGGNNGGTVGDGTIVMRCSPVLVTSGRGVLANSNIFMIGAGYMSMHILGENGVIVSWGYNVDWQLGDGTSGTAGVTSGASAEYKTTGVQVVNTLMAGKSITKMSPGMYMTFVLLSDSTMLMWGYVYFIDS